MSLRLTTLSLLALTLTVTACGDGNKLTETSDTNDTSGTNGNSSSATTTDANTDSTVGMSSAPTTGEIPVTTTDGSDSQTSDVTHQTASSSVSDTDDSAGSASTTEGPVETTTGDNPEIAEQCASVCGKFIECKAMEDQDACTAECTDNLGDDDPACTDANLALLSCIEGMTCVQINAFINDDNPGPCAPQLAAAGEVCIGNECTGSVGTNEDGTECSVSTECPDEPAQTMSCDTKTCTCTVGDMKVGECPAMNVCMAIEDLETKAEACCGF